MATLSEANASPGIVSIVRATAWDALAQKLGVEQIPISIDQRIEAAQIADARKMSMPHDLEHGPDLELDVLPDGVQAMRDLTLAQADDRRDLRVDESASKQARNAEALTRFKRRRKPLLCL